MTAHSVPAARPTAREYVELAGAIVCGLGVAITALFLAVSPMVHHLTGSRDFGVFWATGQQLVHHGNPFDERSMGILERAGGLVGNGTFYMRNPPWVLSLAIPLGWMSPPVASVAWALGLIGLLAISVMQLRKLYGWSGAATDLLAYGFPPALVCVVMGQTTLFVLLGLVLFLRFHSQRPFVAGMALWFWTLKPQLLVPVGVVLLIWIVLTRSYRTVLGLLTALAASSLLIEWIDPAIWTQYLHWARNSGVAQQYIPCLGVFLRDAIRPGSERLAFVPSILASIWALGYFGKRRRAWDWTRDGHLLLLVSLFAAPYCWVYDQCLAIPALLFAAIHARSTKAVAALIALYAVLDLQPFFLPRGINSPLYLWPALAWLLWYAVAERSFRLPERSAEARPEDVVFPAGHEPAATR